MRIGLFYQIQVPKPWTAPARLSDLRGPRADPLCRGNGLRQRVVLRAPFPPGVVAQQRARPDPGGSQPAHQPHPARHRRGAGADPSSTACGRAHGDAGYFEPRPRRRRSRAHRLSLSAHALWLRSWRHTRHVAGVRRHVAENLDPGDIQLRRQVFQDAATRSAAEAACSARIRRSGRLAAATRRRG